MNILSREEALPLTPQATQLLVALALRPSHGYGLKYQVEHDSETAITMKTGGIYPALKRLAQWKFVQKADDDRYELTDQGRDVLAQELDRLNLVVQLGRHRLARKQSHSNATLIMEILPD